MNSELAGETNIHGEQAKWTVGERMGRHAYCVYVINLLQTSSSVVLYSWNVSETLLWRPNGMMKLSFIIQLHYLSIQSPPKVYSRSEAMYI